MRQKIEMIGKRFGKLTIVSESGRTKSGDILWICKCECGNITHPIVGSNLRNGHTKSCGCIGSYTGGHKNGHKKPAQKHGRSNSRLYEVWHGMKKRCYCKTSSGYKYYGDRGITVCEEWRNSFEAFYEWAMSHGYDETAKKYECTLDRIDANGNYEPSNCRWVSMAEQNRNKRR